MKDAIKNFIIVGNLIVGLYCIIEGFRRAKKTGYRFEIKNLFRNVPFSTAPGDFWIAAGVLALFAATICYFWLD